MAIENKPGFEHLSLLNQLDEEDKQTVFKIIGTMFTKRSSKTFSQKNSSFVKQYCR
jgi:hypothetical protein